MEEKIENIVKTIEESFNKLNTSVEQLQKAENIASSSVVTTSTLITEFESSIKTIEKLVKVDFANEYNKVVKINKDLIARIDKIDFDKKFNDTNKKIDDKNFDEDFKSIFDFVSANNEILDSLQLAVIPDGFTNVITAIANKNFDTKFDAVKTQITNKNFDNKFSELTKVISNKNFNINFQSIEEKIRDKNFDNKFKSVEQKILEKNFDPKFQLIQDNFETLAKENRQLKNLIYIVFALILISAISTIFLPKII